MYHCSTRWAHFLLGLRINPRRLVRFFGEGLQPRQDSLAARHVLPRSVFAVYPTIEENISSGELPTTEGNTTFNPKFLNRQGAKHVRWNGPKGDA